MKTLAIYCSMLALWACMGHAQTTDWQQANNSVSITYPMPAGKKVALKLPFATTIKINTWEKAELQFDARVQASDEATKNRHLYKADDLAEQLYIETDLKKNPEGRRDNCWTSNCDSIGQSNGCKCFRVDYEIWMPPGASLTLESINGDVEIKGLTGPVNAKTINGFIDLDRQSAAGSQLRFSSVNGEIYTDFEIDLTQKSNAYHKEVNTSLNGGGASVALETVNGNIFFRKRK